MKYSHSVVFTLLVYTEYVNGCFIRNCPPDSPASKMNSLDIGSSAKVPVSNFISSPEHEVVNVSYCDRSLSVVRPSVNNCLKKHLLWNYVAKFNFVFKIQQWGHDWSTTTTTTATTTKWLTSCSALKKTSPLKLPVQNQRNFTGSFLGQPSTKIQQYVAID